MLYSMSAMQDFDPRIEVIYMKKRILKSVSALLLLAVTAASASPFVMHLSAASSSVSEWERQRQELQDKIDEYNKSIEAAKNDINGALERKAQIDEQIDLITEKIASTNAIIDQYDSDIQKINSRIVDMDSEIDTKYERFESWLRMMQLSGDVNYLEMVLSADSFVSFLETVDRMGTLIEYQNTVMEDLRTDVNAAAEQRDEADTLRAEQLEVKQQLESDNAQLTALQKKSENYITELKKNQAQYEQYLADAEAADEKLGSEIEAELTRIAAEQARKAAEAAANNNSGSTTSGSTISGDRPSYQWPVEGKYVVSSNFGICRGSYHRGIDIPAPLGTSIYAADSGTVTEATYHVSFGNYVLITHENGYATLYAHCSSLLVKPGDTVEKGQTIALVGNTGNSYGCHLHFETYYAGSLVEPLDFFAYMKDKYVISIYGG